MLIANSYFIRPPLSPLVTISCFFFSYVCGSFSVLYISSFVSFFLDSTYKWYNMAFVSVWLTSLSMIISRSIHVAANGIISFFVMAEYWIYIPLYLYTTVYIYIYHCIYIPHLLYAFICRWTLGCFHASATMNSAAMNIGMHVSFQSMVFSRYMPRIGSYMQDHMVTHFYHNSFPNLFFH